MTGRMKIDAAGIATIAIFAFLRAAGHVSGQEITETPCIVISRNEDTFSDVVKALATNCTAQGYDVESDTTVTCTLDYSKFPYYDAFNTTCNTRKFESNVVCQKPISASCCLVEKRSDYIRVDSHQPPFPRARQK